MSEVAHETHQEFWRPPSPAAADQVVASEAIPAMAEVCDRCGTEFLHGSRFCHSCGAKRPPALQSGTDTAMAARLWGQTINRVQTAVARLPLTRVWRSIKFPGWLHYLHFHEIQRSVGLSTASLVAFIIGLVCVAGALMVGLLTAKTFVDWQAIQFYRGEWLLAATAAFVAAILLKKSSARDDE
jgi:hypothetical protein